MVQGKKGLLWEKTMLWHKILWYIAEKGLQKLHGKGMVEGMYDCTLNFDLYEHCIYGKQNQVGFASGTTRKKGTLELIQNDVFGPMPIPSLGKSMYYVSFIDDFSMNTWIYFIKRNMRYSKNSKSSRLL